ncbi:MAG: hypothetical protein RIS22_365 [Actinomycetota bacterium]|jgi:tetratricopeptide (TPR) repeat protein
MSLRFRRSISLIPGVRLNFSKSAIGLSVGVPGARVSINSKGDIYTSAGIPGTGLYNVERSSIRGSKSSPSRRTSGEENDDFYLPPKPPKPSLFANKRERAFYRFLTEHFEGENVPVDKVVIERAIALSEQHPKIKYTCLALACLAGARNGENFPDLVKSAGEVWSNRKNAFGTYEARKYFPLLNMKIQITPGIWFDESFSASAFGFIYAEILQDAGDSASAFKVLEMLDANQLSAVSVVDIELAEKKFQDVLDSTEDLELEDEATGMLFIMRAAALSELGFHDGALEAIKKVIAKRSLDEEVHNRALWERANIYQRQGKRGQALKELEKIVLADSKYPEVMERITALRAEDR